MKKQLIFALAITAALALAALAQGGPKNGDASPDKPPTVKPKIKTDHNLIGTQVRLQCTVGGPSEFPTITITNHTGQTIQKDTRVFWHVNAVMKGSLVLQKALAPGQTVKFDTEALGAGGTPAAWYFK